MKYLISSHLLYYQETLPGLVDSLVRAGIDTADITIYIAGATSRNSGFLHACEAHFVDHNSFEHTALIEFARSPADDSAFLLHDTTLAGPRFGELSRPRGDDWQHAPADPVGWTNMGFYSAAFLQEQRAYIDSLFNCSKRRAQMSERLFTRMADPCGSYGPRPPQDMGQSQPYGGAPRLKVYYPELDLFKFMANHAGAGAHFRP